MIEATFWPAWQSQRAREPAGVVTAMLLVYPACDLDPTEYTLEKRIAVIGIARFIVRNDDPGPEEPENLKSLVDIEHAWAEDDRGSTCSITPTAS